MTKRFFVLNYFIEKSFTFSARISSITKSINSRFFVLTGEIIPLEEKKPDLKNDKKKGSRLVREEDAGDDEVSDDERVDMNAITGAKEREERRDQFYAAENDCMCLLLLSLDKTTILLCLQKITFIYKIKNLYVEKEKLFKNTQKQNTSPTEKRIRINVPLFSFDILVRLGR